MENTTFAVTLTKGDGNKYAVELGEDILGGLSDEVIQKYAEQTAVINMQGGLRKAEDGEALLKALQDLNHMKATVEVYVAPEPKARKTPSVDDFLKALAEGKITMKELEDAQTK